jgi:RecA-family ATPase
MNSRASGLVESEIIGVYDANKVASKSRQNGANGVNKRDVDDTFEAPVPIFPHLILGKAPERRWLVRDWIPMGDVTGIYGDGGLGKTTLAQQLLTSCAIAGRTWLGLHVEPVPSIGFFCEDTETELWRRQDVINAHPAYHAQKSDLCDAVWLPRRGQDNVLIRFSKTGCAELTPLYFWLREYALDIKAKLVEIDPASYVFGGDENDRHEVTRFVDGALGDMALKLGAAVVLTAHPSRSGLRSGSNDAGSTAWQNTFRSRLSISPAPDVDGIADVDGRVLHRHKSNFAKRDEVINFRYDNGVFAPRSAAYDTAYRRPAEDVFMALLDEHIAQNRGPLSPSKNSGSNYAPRIFAQKLEQERDGYGQDQFARAMDGLLRAEALVIETYGRKGDERRKILRAGSRLL